MSVTLKWDDYLRFREEVLMTSRYIRTAATKRYLRAVEETCKTRIISIAQNTEFWRARLEGLVVPCGEDDETIVEYNPKDMGAPPRSFCRASRIAVIGIPVLYVSSDKETAMSEARPWKGQRVTCGRLSTTKTLRVVDCQQNDLTGSVSDFDKLWPCQALFRKEEISDAENQDRAWAWIDHAFSEPVSSSDASREYVPTQIIAEIFKAAGYDGIKYGSSVASGHNVAVFDVNAAEVLETELYYTNDISYTFSKKQFPT